MKDPSDPTYRYLVLLGQGYTHASSSFHWCCTGGNQVKTRVPTQQPKHEDDIKIARANPDGSSPQYTPRLALIPDAQIQIPCAAHPPASSRLNLRQRQRQQRTATGYAAFHRHDSPDPRGVVVQDHLPIRYLPFPFPLRQAANTCRRAVKPLPQRLVSCG